MQKVPAGAALLCDREKFASIITKIICQHPNITLHIKEIDTVPESPAIVATGPLTSEKLIKSITRVFGSKYLYFYDAAAPIVTRDSIDFDIAFWGSRYNKGDNDYVNLPMTKDEYNNFYNQLITAEVNPLKEFEKAAFLKAVCQSKLWRKEVTKPCCLVH